MPQQVHHAQGYKGIIDTMRWIQCARVHALDFGIELSLSSVCNCTCIYGRWATQPGNLLLSASDGRLVLGDFGLARMYGDSGSGMGGGGGGGMGGIGPDVRYTPQSVTRWYRAPELLFGADLYGPSVDMWSVGCVFAELMLRTPYFPGDSDLDQLAKIFAALGTPTDDMWPVSSQL